IKVESVAHLDGMRAVQPSAPGRADSVNLGGWYNNANCGKMSAVLNLQHLGAKDVLLSLVRVADAVVENFTYPTLERLGYGVDVLRSVNPSLVVLRLPPMGTTGPRATLSGFGFSMLALAGVSNLVGPPERPPTGFGVTFGDSVSTPGHGAVSLFAALLHRRRTGQGQVIDMSQVEAATAMLGGALLDYAVNGRVQQRTGNRSPWACPHNAYRCKGDDRWCVIAVFTDEEWGALAAMLGQRAWLTDARFASVEARKQHEDDLDALIEAWTSQRTPDEVMETLQRAGVPSGALRSPNDVLHGDAHLKARGYYRWLPHPETPAMLVNGPLYRLSAADPNAIRRAPLIGEHNEAVYQELLGMAEAKADQLAVDGVIQ
ncbi:MAG: CoA transferase, partial [Chloroflexi bacterium]|nr:CoA transferase [Chloroflexota bacterium]